MGTFHRDQRRIFSIGLYSKLKFGQFLPRSGAVSATFSDFLSGTDTNATRRKINPEAPIRSPSGAICLFLKIVQTLVKVAHGGNYDSEIRFYRFLVYVS